MAATVKCTLGECNRVVCITHSHERRREHYGTQVTGASYSQTSGQVSYSTQKFVSAVERYNVCSDCHAWLNVCAEHPMQTASQFSGQCPYPLYQVAVCFTLCLAAYWYNEHFVKRYCEYLLRVSRARMDSLRSRVLGGDLDRYNRYQKVMYESSIAQGNLCGCADPLPYDVPGNVEAR